MGWHYTDAVDDVRRLKREGRTGEAEALLLRCVDATEAEARREGYAPAPWYYDQLAAIYRQQSDPAKEVAILERYVTTTGVEKARRNNTGSKILGRLEKARALLAARESEPLSFCPYCGVEITPPAQDEPRLSYLRREGSPRQTGRRGTSEPDDRRASRGEQAACGRDPFAKEGA